MNEKVDTRAASLITVYAQVESFPRLGRGPRDIGSQAVPQPTCIDLSNLIGWNSCRLPGGECVHQNCLRPCNLWAIGPREHWNTYTGLETPLYSWPCLLGISISFNPQRLAPPSQSDQYKILIRNNRTHLFRLCTLSFNFCAEDSKKRGYWHCGTLP